MDRITDRPDMTSVVYRGRKASSQINKQTKKYWSDSDEIMSVYNKTNVHKKSSSNFIMHMLNIVLLRRQRQILNGYFAVNNRNNS